MSEVLDAGQKLLGPALVTSLLVMLLFRKVCGPRVAAALAVTAAVLAGNHFRDVFPYRLDIDHPLTFSTWGAALDSSLEARPTVEGEEAVAPPPVYFWLPRLTALAVVVEVCVAASGPGWAARAVVAMVAGRLLIPASLRAEFVWAPWCLGLVLLLQWGVTTSLARRWNDGLIPMVQAACLMAAGVVILHAHSGRLADAALLFGMALAGPALVATVWPGDYSTAAAAGAFAIPGLLFVAHQDTFSDVPLWSFILIGLAPLTLLLALIPALARQRSWKRWLLAALPIGPAGIAVAMAARAESLPF